MGDSRTDPAIVTWPRTLVAALSTATSPVPWVGLNYGIGGASVATAAANIDTVLTMLPDDGTMGRHTAVLMSWGVNYTDNTADETTWTTDYLAIIDKVHARAPEAKIYLMRPWYQGYDARAAVLHGWIDNIVAARAFTYVGPDEAVWLKADDNGAARMVDAKHYNALGNTDCAAEWQTVLGF